VPPSEILHTATWKSFILILRIFEGQDKLKKFQNS
jgi:hypothetical protein